MLTLFNSFELPQNILTKYDFMIPYKRAILSRFIFYLIII